MVGMAEESQTIVYTDGACLGNPGPGGWAFAVKDGPEGFGADPNTTNQRMELTACLEAISALSGHKNILVRSDSTYVVKCFTDRWWVTWLKKGWKNSAGKDVANRDIWEPLLELVAGHGAISFEWVKGHAGDLMNEYVDQLANSAARNIG